MKPEGGKVMPNGQHYQWTLILRVLINIYILSNNLFLCEYIFLYLWAFPNVTASFLLPLTWFPSVCIMDTFHKNSFNTYPVGICIYVLPNNMHAPFHCYIFYTPQYSQKKRTEHGRINRHQIPLFLPALSWISLCIPWEMLTLCWKPLRFCCVSVKGTG